VEEENLSGVVSCPENNSALYNSDIVYRPMPPIGKTTLPVCIMIVRNLYRLH